MKFVRRFMSHSGGVSAIEFAIAAPLLVMMLAGLVSGWTYLTQVQQMRSAIKSGANYILQGGTDLAAAKSAILLTWANKPADADVQIVRQCSCASTVSTCSAVCASDGSIPNMSVVVTVSASLDTPFHSLFKMTKMQTSREARIRVR